MFNPRFDKFVRPTEMEMCEYASLDCIFIVLTHLSAKEIVQSENDSIPARASLSGFAASYNFSISPTCGFAFGDVFIWSILHIRHLES